MKNEKQKCTEVRKYECFHTQLRHTVQTHIISGIILILRRVPILRGREFDRAIFIATSISRVARSCWRSFGSSNARSSARQSSYTENVVGQTRLAK